MAPKITSSSNRSKRKPASPRTITQGQYPQRNNRQRVSTAQVTNSAEKNPNRVRAGINQSNKPGAGRVTGTLGRPKPATPPKVTNDAQRTNASRRALPPGNQGGALSKRPNMSAAQRERFMAVNVRDLGTKQPTRMSGRDQKSLPPRQNALPASTNPRREAAQNKLNEAAKGSNGRYRVGQPAGAANRMYGANRVNAAVARAEQQAARGRAMARGTVATSVMGALLDAPEEFRKGQRLLQNPRGEFQKVANDMGITMFDAPKSNLKANPTRPSLTSTGARISDKQNKLDYETVPTGSAAYNSYRDKQIESERNRLKKVGNPTPSTARQTETRSSGRPRPAAQQPSLAIRSNVQSPKSKPANATEQASTSGIGPVKDAQQYSNMKRSVSETVRELQEMQKRSRERQKRTAKV